MLKKIAIVVAVVIVGVLGYAATLPDSFAVTRSLAMKAPPEKVYGLIEDFHQWSAWSPWEKLDPAMNRTHSGAERGKGAVYAWQGNDQVGKGRMEILEAAPPRKVSIKLEFLEPWQATNVADFELEPAGDTTTVTWSMHGPQPYVSKVMCVFMDMDSMIGKDFEKGLANMKAAAER